MEFEVMMTGFFKSQAENLDAKSKRILLGKVRLIKLKPFRYRRLHPNEYSRVYGVRLTVENKSVRMIYAVVGDKIWVVCLDDRDNDYRNLDDYLRKYLKGLI